MHHHNQTVKKVASSDGLIHLPSLFYYGSTTTTTTTTQQQQQEDQEEDRVVPPPAPQSLLLPNHFLMGPTDDDASDSDNNNASSPSSSPTAELNNSDQESPSSSFSDSSIIVGDTILLQVQQEEEKEPSIVDVNQEAVEDTAQQPIMTNNSRNSSMNSSNSVLPTLLNTLLQKPVLADSSFLTQYPLLLTLLQNGKYVTFTFLAAYILFLLLLWLPFWILSQLITEPGVYALLLLSVVYGGRCLLRLLAFPGTNVKVYGEIENEFDKYSTKMLEGASSALDDFGKCLRAGTSSKGRLESKSKVPTLTGMDANDGWELVDLHATYKRLEVYKKRVLGVYREVLHCLLEENGQGNDPSHPNNGHVNVTNNGTADCNGFYRLGENVRECKDTCKRNLCCQNGRSTSSNSDVVEGNIPQLDLPTFGSPTMNSGSYNDDTTSSSTTCYGNNPLMGDVGNMGNLTLQARTDGRELYQLLSSILEDLSTLEASSSNVLRNMEDRDALKNAIVSEETVGHATKLIARAQELKEFVSRIKLPSDADNNENEDNDHPQEDETEVTPEAVRNRLEEQGTASSTGSTMDMVWSALSAFGNMIDPPPHKSIFGLDVIRGCFLARYQGARQFWVQRGSSGSGGDGRLDVIMIPSSSSSTTNEVSSPMKQPADSFLPLSPRKGRTDGNDAAGAAAGGEQKKKRKAVLYCNPNAGLVEVATGMGLTGGNVDGDEDDDEEKEPTCWTEYYIEHGYDVYLFNYAGYGRSYGGNSWNDHSSSEYSHGFFAALKRVLFSTFVAFKPSSESLKSDAAAVANYLVEVVGVNELIIHGESIGGMAAAGAARALTTTGTLPKCSTLLICDRTFCNLEAVAQRLVGQWTGNAIRLLTPTWSTDVARDYLAANCPKIVANDCADEIIHDYSSLKSGCGFAGELTKGMTKNVGWAMSSPVEYRVADLDNVGVANSRLACSCCPMIKNPPTWPADKHVSWVEAHHFAACVKRIGKLATSKKKQMQEANKVGESANEADDEEGIEVPLSPDESSVKQHSSSLVMMEKNMSESKALIKLWSKLLLCDGLCGHHLGHAVKEGFDCTIAWLCCTVIFGSQVLAEQAEKRWDYEQQQQMSSPDHLASSSSIGLEDDDRHVFITKDFDLRPHGYEWDDDDIVKHPLPIPEVLSSLKEMAAQKNTLNEVEAELNYVIGMLNYIVSRLTSKENMVLSLKRRNGCLDEQGVISTGCFLNLHCGHNNQYSYEEREKLIGLIRRLGGDSSV